LVALASLLAVPSAAGAAGWSRSYTLSSTNLTEPAPRVAVGPNGTVVVAWLRKRDLRVAIGNSRGRFSGSQVLTSRGLRPRVAVGPNGRAIVVWNESRGLRYATRAPGQRRFGHTRTLTTPRGKSSDDFAVVAMDSAGTVTVVFEHTYRSRTQYNDIVQVLTVSKDGARTPIVSLGAGSIPRRPTLALSASGDAVTTFVPTPPASQSAAPVNLAPIVARRIGGTWSTRPFPFTEGRRVENPSIGLDATGRLTFSFTDVVRSGEATSFGLPRLSDGPFAGPFGPPSGPTPRRADKAFGPLGVPVSDANVLVWQEKTSASPFSTEAPVWAARIAFDGTVGTPQTLDSAKKAFEPHLVQVDADRALVVWGDPRIAAAIYRAVRGFQRISAPTGRATLGGTDFNVNRDLASNGRGVAAFTWTENERVRISVRRF
jgi:hypothetical protein